MKAALIARLKAGASLVLTLDPASAKWREAVALHTDGEKTFRALYGPTECLCVDVSAGPLTAAIRCDACCAVAPVLLDGVPWTPQ